MKKRITILVALLLVVVSAMSVVLAGCGMFGDKGGGDNNNQQTEPVTYTIQYADDAGTHTITVQSGQLYSVDVIPQRIGYEFMGLFDAQTGGAQYVSANGTSVSAFTDNKNLVLYPQFKPKTYTIVLNYGEAAITGPREIKVEYNNEIPELPVNLSVPNKNFIGWYTEPDRKGVQIANDYGVNPERRLLTEENFNISAESDYIYLYAGFKGVPRTVTFYVEDSYTPIEMEVEHGTLITDIVPKYRTEEGFAVYEWTQSSNPTESSPVFKGAIVADTVLYAKTYAPVIELDPNGGEDITPVVQQAGKSVTLPTPVRENYKFLYWADEDGEEATYTTMPSQSVSLTAVWQAMIVLDENGGDDVEDISEEAGATVTLPTPEREGFFFAGWFDADGEKYESTKMPSASVALKAGWYKAKEVNLILLSGNEEIDCTDTDPVIKNALTMDLSAYLPADFNGSISFTVTWKARHEQCSTKEPAKVVIAFYSSKTVSDSTLIGSSTISCDDTKIFVRGKKTMSSDLKGNQIYVAICSDMRGNLLFGTRNYGVVSDISVEVLYPDTNAMY